MVSCGYHVYIRDVHIRNDGIWECYMEYAKCTHCKTCIPIMKYMTNFILLITIWYDMRNRRENEMKYQLGKNWSEDCNIDCA